MCVLDLWMLCLYVERCFESLTCWVDLCLSSLLVAFNFMCFSSRKTSFLQALLHLNRYLDTSISIEPLCFTLDRFSTTGRSIEIFFWPLCLLNRSSTQSRSIKISRFLLDKISIASRSIEINFCALCLLNRFSTNPRSIELTFLLLIAPQQILFCWDLVLDRFLTDSRQILDPSSCVFYI